MYFRCADISQEGDSPDDNVFQGEGGFQPKGDG